MLVVIAGAGSVGRAIARELLSHGHEVTVVDANPDAMKVSSVAEANWILGDLTSPDVMERAGVAGAEVVVTATGDDTANLVISLLAKTQFGVPRVIARVNNPKNEWMFDDSWGVDVSLSIPRMMTAMVEQVVSSDLDSSLGIRATGGLGQTGVQEGTPRATQSQPAQPQDQSE